MARGGRKRAVVIEDEGSAVEESPIAESPDPAPEPPAPVSPPPRVFRRPIPTTPATQTPAQVRNTDVSRCDPYIPVNTQTGERGLGMFLMLLSAWADKIQFSDGMKEFIMKGDSLKWVSDKNDPRGKGYMLRVVSPIHVRANPHALSCMPGRGCGGQPPRAFKAFQFGQLNDYDNFVW